jgi:hypothetical protein
MLQKMVEDKIKGEGAAQPRKGPRAFSPAASLITSKERSQKLSTSCERGEVSARRSDLG